MSRAVVLGGGLAGMLAAAVLAPHVGEVVVIESDSYPDAPAPRKGLPQGYHSHMFLTGGARAVDALLPGVLDELYAAGAKKRGLPGGTLTLTSEGWYRRMETDGFSVVCSRDLTDHVVRRRVLADARIVVRERTVVEGLVGSAARVTGVRVRPAGGAAEGGAPVVAEEVVDADFVVDATGRRSRSPQWLSAVGLPAVAEEGIDSGLAYATRLFEAPAGAGDDFPAVLIQPQSGTGKPGQGATLFPIEGGRWIVTLTGTRGGEPPTDEAGFLACARGMRHPIIAELIEDAVPLGAIRPYRGTANRRRYYDKLPLPEGFVVMGDAAASLNPVYAHGMSVAALSAVALRDLLAKGGLRPGLSRKAQKAFAKTADWPWTMASGQDRGFPGTTADKEVKTSAFEQKMAVAMARAALSEEKVAAAIYQTYTLAAPASKAMTPGVMFAAYRGPRQAPLTAEQAIAQYPEFGELRTGLTTAS